MFRIAKKTALSISAVLLLGATLAQADATPYPDEGNSEASGLAMAADLVVARPLGLIASVLGHRYIHRRPADRSDFGRCLRAGPAVDRRAGEIHVQPPRSARSTSSRRGRSHRGLVGHGGHDHSFRQCQSAQLATVGIQHLHLA